MMLHGPMERNRCWRKKTAHSFAKIATLDMAPTDCPWCCRCSWTTIATSYRSPCSTNGPKNYSVSLHRSKNPEPLHHRWTFCGTNAGASADQVDQLRSCDPDRYRQLLNGLRWKCYEVTLSKKKTEFQVSPKEAFPLFRVKK